MEIPRLIVDLALILLTAGFVTLLFKKLRQPLVLGYIVAGFLVSPMMPYTPSVMNAGSIKVWSDIGVVFLLFALGLDFSFKKITKMGSAPIIAAVTIVFCMILLGIGAGNLFGWGHMNCIFLGGMLAMSSTTIIYKAFDDMGLRQQNFASMVMSVLILEDILAIVLMVMLSAIAEGSSLSGEQLLNSIIRIGFFVILWFIVGIFIIPFILRRTRKLMTNETLLIVALALCFLMAVIASQVGFSYAFGAFIMGSILAETLEADRIEKIITPVKDLFGAIFFVSVGMMVNPSILVQYAIPIVILVGAIIFGHSIFSTFAYFISGQSFKNAISCGFSMAQIGEFAFIIASLGMSLGVIDEFIYPVVVAVSVITTFITPYMIKAAPLTYEFLEKHLPSKWIMTMNSLTVPKPDNVEKENKWKSYILYFIKQTIIFLCLCSAIYLLMYYFGSPLIDRLLPAPWNRITTIVLCILLMSPFIRAIAMKKIRGEKFMYLWNAHHLNRFPLSFIICLRMLIAAYIVFFIINTWTHFSYAVMCSVAVFILFLIVSSQRIRRHGISIEKVFLENLHAREEPTVAKDGALAKYGKRLNDRNIHITDIIIPEDSCWSGKNLREADFRGNFGIYVSSILRGSHRINIPNASTILFPGDRLQVIGTDAQLMKMNHAIVNDIWQYDTNTEQQEMELRQFCLKENSEYVGKTLATSDIRSKYNCMVIGFDDGDDDLTQPNPQRTFVAGDIIWVAGEHSSLMLLGTSL